MAKSRLDQALVERGLCESREKAKRLVLAGQVRINGHPARKPSDGVKAEDEIGVDAPERFVSRGGHKLEHALEHFQLDVAGLTAIDLGASTGGFTDCLLQRGTEKVFAVDVGQGQLAWKLRQDPRVVVMENTNARFLKAEDFAGKTAARGGGKEARPHPGPLPRGEGDVVSALDRRPASGFTEIQEFVGRTRSGNTSSKPVGTRDEVSPAAGSQVSGPPADLIVVDCSFISLKKILPPAVTLLKAGGRIVALIKPQFEAGKAEADKGRGVITDAGIHRRVLAELEEFVATQAGLCWRGVVESPLLGPAGNKEFLALIEKIH